MKSCSLQHYISTDKVKRLTKGPACTYPNLSQLDQHNVHIGRWWLFISVSVRTYCCPSMACSLWILELGCDGYSSRLVVVFISVEANS